MKYATYILTFIFLCVSTVFYAQTKKQIDAKMDSLDRRAFHQLQTASYFDAIRTINLLTETAIEHNDSIYLASSYNSVALAHVQNHAYEEAITNYLKSIELYKKLPINKPLSGVYSNIGAVYSNLAHCYMLNNDTVGYRKTLKISRAVNKKNLISKYWDYETEIMWLYRNKVNDSLVLKANEALKILASDSLVGIKNNKKRNIIRERLQTTYEIYLAYGLFETGANLAKTDALLNKCKNKKLEDILWFSSRVYQHYYKLCSYKSQVLLKKKNINRDSVRHYQLLADNYFKQTVDLIEDRSENHTSYIDQLIRVEQEMDHLKTEKASKEKESNLIKKISLLILMVALCMLCILIYSVFLNKKVKKINTVLDQTNEKLKRSIENRNKFLTVISHGIRTPLYALQNSISKLSFNTNSSFAEDVLLANYSLVNLKQTVDNAFQFSRIAYFKNETSKILKLTNLNEFMKYVLLELDSLLKLNQVSIQMQIDIAKHHFQLPHLKLKLVLQNIIKNALEEKDVFNVMIVISETENSPTNATLNFTIRDDGPGISKTDLDYIAGGEINVLDENSQKGIRMGLILSNKILSYYNSKLEFKPIKGANEVAFKLEDVTTTIVEEPESETSETIKFEPKNILFVDDNSANLYITKRILKSIGHKCTTTDNGYEAIELVKETNFDLILMDINMPIIDGYETTIEIRKFNTEIPIVAYTALSEDIIFKQCEAVGIKEILTKPLTEEEFEKFIAAMFST